MVASSSTPPRRRIGSGDQTLRAKLRHRASSRKWQHTCSRSPTTLHLIGSSTYPKVPDLKHVDCCLKKGRPAPALRQHEPRRRHGSGKVDAAAARGGGAVEGDRRLPPVSQHDGIAAHARPKGHCLSATSADAGVAGESSMLEVEGPLDARSRRTRPPWVEATGQEKWAEVEGNGHRGNDA